MTLGSWASPSAAWSDYIARSWWASPTSATIYHKVVIRRTQVIHNRLQQPSSIPKFCCSFWRLKSPGSWAHPTQPRASPQWPCPTPPWTSANLESDDLLCLGGRWPHLALPAASPFGSTLATCSGVGRSTQPAPTEQHGMRMSRVKGELSRPHGKIRPTKKKKKKIA